MEESKKRCVACKEFIHSQASICPHCSTRQHISTMSKFGSLVKWLGGFTAVISVVIGVKQLNDFTSEWQAKQQSVKTLVEAANIQIELANYPAAWNLLEEGYQLEPSSQQINQRRTGLAILWISENKKFFDSDKNKTMMKKLIPTLYQGLVTKDQAQKARILATIGRGNHLAFNINEPIDRYFAEAIAIDPADPVNVKYWISWILDNDNRKKYSEGNVKKAMALHNRLSKQDQELNYAYLLRSLVYSRTIEGDIQVFKLANQYRLESKSLEIPIKVLILNTLKTDFLPDSYEQRLGVKSKALPMGDFVKTIKWLGEDLYENNERLNKNTISALRFQLILALAESLENKVAGIQRLRKIVAEFPPEPGLYRNAVNELINLSQYAEM